MSRTIEPRVLREMYIAGWLSGPVPSSRPSCDGIDCAGMGPVGLDIGTVAIEPATAAIYLHRLRKRIRTAIVAVEEKGALVDMAVPAQNQIHSVCFQDRQGVLPHLDQACIGVRIMGAFV